MSNVEARLVSAFRLVFEQLSDEQIKCASQVRLESWDSLAGIALLSIVEEEFNVEVDYSRLAELNTFSSILSYLTTSLSVA
jgi:acyl carrier protein